MYDNKITAQKLQDTFGVDEENAEKILEALDAGDRRLAQNTTLHPSHLVADILSAVDACLPLSCGVEGILGVQDEGTADSVDVQYCNMGDTYSPTVLYDGERGEFAIGDWGSIVEEAGS